MGRYGAAGRALRSPLNPGWMAGQPLRAGGAAMAGTMPAVSQLGDQLVDQQSEAISGMAGRGVDALLPHIAQELPGGLGGQLTSAAPGIRDAVMRGAPDMAKALGRAGWAGGAGMLGAAGDILSGEDPRAGLANVARAGMMSPPMPRGEGGGPGAGGGLPPPSAGPEAGIEALLMGTGPGGLLGTMASIPGTAAQIERLGGGFPMGPGGAHGGGAPAPDKNVAGVQTLMNAARAALAPGGGGGGVAPSPAPAPAATRGMSFAAPPPQAPPLGISTLGGGGGGQSMPFPLDPSFFRPMPSAAGADQAMDQKYMSMPPMSVPPGISTLGAGAPRPPVTPYPMDPRKLRNPYGG